MGADYSRACTQYSVACGYGGRTDKEQFPEELFGPDGQLKDGVTITLSDSEPKEQAGGGGEAEENMSPSFRRKVVARGMDSTLDTPQILTGGNDSTNTAALTAEEVHEKQLAALSSEVKSGESGAGGGHSPHDGALDGDDDGGGGGGGGHSSDEDNDARSPSRRNRSQSRSSISSQISIGSQGLGSSSDDGEENLTKDAYLVKPNSHRVTRPYGEKRVSVDADTDPSRRASSLEIESDKDDDDDDDDEEEDESAVAAVGSGHRRMRSRSFAPWENKHAPADNDPLAPKARRVLGVVAGQSTSNLLAEVREESVPVEDETVPVKDDSPEARRLRLRRNVVMEVLSTEKSYVASLEQLDEMYIRPIHEAVGSEDAVLSKDAVGKVFGDIQTVTNLNQRFLRELEERVNQSTSSTIPLGDLFLQYAPFFKIYVSYVSNHEEATRFLNQVQKNPRKFERFLTFCETASVKCGGASLTSYLIMPIQRIPRYKLLLEEVLKRTDESDADYKPLQEALDVMKRTATSINEAIRTQEENTKVFMIQEAFSGSVSFLAPGRRFVRNGQLNTVNKTRDERHWFFLFNDLLVMADKQLGQFRVLHEFDLSEHFLLRDIADVEHSSDTLKATQGLRSFAFVIRSYTYSFMAYANTKDEKDDWMRDIQACLDEISKLIKRKGSDPERKIKFAPIVAQFTGSSKCHVCTNTVTRLNRRTHCRSCGLVVHLQCAQSKLVVPGTHEKTLKRVCDTCAKSIQQAFYQNLASQQPASQQPAAAESEARGSQDEAPETSFSEASLTISTSAVNTAEPKRVPPPLPSRPAAKSIGGPRPHAPPTLPKRPSQAASAEAQSDSGPVDALAASFDTSSAAQIAEVTPSFSVSALAAMAEAAATKPAVPPRPSGTQASPRSPLGGPADAAAAQVAEAGSGLRSEWEDELQRPDASVKPGDDADVEHSVSVSVSAADPLLEILNTQENETDAPAPIGAHQRVVTKSNAMPDDIGSPTNPQTSRSVKRRGSVQSIASDLAGPGAAEEDPDESPTW